MIFVESAAHTCLARRVWSDCINDRAYISLYGAYLTIRNMARIVERLNQTIAE